MSAKGLYRIRWRRIVLKNRVSVCETFRKYYGNVEQVEGLENSWQTDSIGKTNVFRLMASGLKNDVYFMCSVCLASWLKERRMFHV